jgi:enamine deaminase RidA (YjgF/YER057c/UK114 family)
MIEKFNPAGMPASPAYSQGALANGAQKLLFVSGQVGVDAQGNVPEGVGEQALLAIGNLNRVLEGAGMTSANIAKYTIYLTDESDMAAFVAAAGGTLPTPPPAATLLFVKALGAPNLKVEIEAIAAA